MNWLRSIYARHFARRTSGRPSGTVAGAVSSSMPPHARLLDPAILGRIGSFELISQSVVDGVMSGKHRSTHRGGCCEFSEHRAYSQGDEMRLIDWRLFARRDQPYVKLFDDETNLHAWLVVDSSGSMSFGQSTATKFDYACMASACLGRLLLRQRDSVGLLCELDGRAVRLPPRPQASHFQAICNALHHARPQGNQQLPLLLNKLMTVIKRRGMVIIFSDCFGDVDRLASALKLLRVRGHDVMVFQVLAPEEQTFSFRGSAIFEDLERLSPRLHVNPGVMRRRYLERFQAFQGKLRAEMVRANCDLYTLSTDRDLGEALSHFLSYRKARTKAMARA
jgi:uncharacterized protein (DUF58 family)